MHFEQTADSDTVSTYQLSLVQIWNKQPRYKLQQLIELIIELFIEKRFDTK